MNLFEIGLSFFEGVALISSPCILPILPIILSASIDGGRRRPFGIIMGFILTFTIFALLSREFVSVLHVNLNYIKNGSLIILALFGITLLFETLSSKFSNLTQGFASKGTTLSANTQDGFLSGVLIGTLIGLVWTPCAGPILAIALVQIIRQKNNLNAVWLILAFAIGAGVPMLIISLTGKKLMTKLKFLSNNYIIVRKVLGVLVLITVAFIAFGFNLDIFSTKMNQKGASFMLQNKLQNSLLQPYLAPEFAASDIWLNTPDNRPITQNSLKGKVVLVDFWTYSCINCIRTLPYINDWYRKYHDKRLEIVGVHAPEFEFEKNKTNVIQAIARYQIKYPVAMDNNLDTWTNFNNQYWPAHYLIDKNGYVVYTKFGEGEYQETENNIRFLLGLNNIIPNETNDINFYSQTPETYLGYERSTAFYSPENMIYDMAHEYTLPKSLPPNRWALSGQWLIQGQRIVSKGVNTRLQLNFNAQHVYLVLGNSSNTPINITLKLNGEPVGAKAGRDAPDGIVNVQEHRLYELINQGKSANGLLEIIIPTPGLEAYAFTFG